MPHKQTIQATSFIARYEYLEHQVVREYLVNEVEFITNARYEESRVCG